ncbi:MAG: hypothetical protein AAF517_02035 [Planctomycetota bacterium]
MIAVLRKELRQHLAFLICVAVLTGLGLAMLVFSTARQGGDRLTAFSLFLQTVTPICAALVSGRVLLSEFRWNTRAFVLSLPVSWWRVVAAKMVFAYAAFIATLLALLSWVYRAENADSFLPSELLVPLFARTLTFSSCLFAFFCVLNVLGKFRAIGYLLVLITASVLSQNGLQLNQVLPLSLVGEQFASEGTLSTELIDGLRITWIATGVLTLVAATLFVVKRGDWAARLAAPMTYQEKLMTSLLVVLLASFLSQLLSASKIENYTIPGATIHTSELIHLELLDEEEGEHGDPIEPLDRFLIRSLQDLVETLGLETFPRIYVEFSPSADGDRVDIQRYPELPGVFLHANWRDQNWRRREFLAAVAREALYERSPGLTREDRIFLLDGFVTLWAYGGLKDSSELPELLARRAAYGARGGGLPRLSEWLRVEARHGAHVADALAASFLWKLVQDRGLTRTIELCRTLLGPTSGRNFTEWFASPSFDRSVRRILGEGGRALESAWHESLASAQNQTLGELPADLRADAEVRGKDLFVKVIGETTGLTGLVFLSEKIVHRRRIPDPLHSNAEALSAGEDWQHAASELVPGDRVQWTIRAESAALDCEVFSGWTVAEVER